MAIINFPILYVPDPVKGRPLFNGQIFIGEPDLDPEIPSNQKLVSFVQEDGTLVPTTQPINLSAGGVPVYNGTPVRLDVDGNYSIKILSKPPNGTQVYYIENVFEGQPVLVEDLPQYVTAEFSTVSNMVNGISQNLGVIDFSEYAGREVTTVSHNQNSEEGGATYTIWTLEAYRSFIGNPTWTPESSGSPNYYGINHYVGGTDYVAILKVINDTVSVSCAGVVADGVTDSWEPIARCLDLSLPIRNWTFPKGEVFVSQTVLLPLTPLNDGCLVIDGTGCKLIGPNDNSIYIFETANTSFSFGGTSNWNDPPESSIHSNTHIKNFSFEFYDIALRLYNFNFNCEVVGSIGRQGKTFMHAKRCFYLTFTQNTIRNGYVGKPDDEVTIRLEEFTNVMYFDDNHISNWNGSQATGIGIMFMTGANAFNLADCAIEGCKIGVYFSGENRPLDVTGVYFEANERSMYHNDGALSGTVSNCWFADPIIFDAEPTTASQFVFDKNFSPVDGDIIEPSAVSTLQIRDGARFANSNDYSAGVTRPASQMIAESAKFLNEGFQIAFNAIDGFAGAGGRSHIPYNDMLMPFNYFGRLFRINTPIPFVDITYSDPDLILDTQIQFLDRYNGGVEYDLTIDHSGGTSYISGRTLNDASVFEYDSVGYTVAVTNNAGFIRFTVTGFPTGSDPQIRGRIRAV